MFSAREMFAVSHIQEFMDNAVFVEFDGDMTPTQVKQKTQSVLSAAKMTKYVPDFITTITIRVKDEDPNKVDSVRVTIKLRERDKINGEDSFRYSSTFWYNDSYKEKLIKFVAGWFDDYSRTLMAIANAEELTSKIEPLCDVVKIGFAYSDKAVVSITDKSIVLGLSAEALAYAATLPLFLDVDLVSDLYLGGIKDLLSSFTEPWEVLTSKAQFFKELGVYTRVNFAKILRKTFKKDIKDKKNVDVVCKLDFGGCFGLVKRVADEQVIEGTPVLHSEDGYSYVTVLTPFSFTDDGIPTFVTEDEAVVLIQSALVA